MTARSRWSSDELEQVRGLAATYFTKEVLPNVPKHVAQGTRTRRSTGGRASWGCSCMSIPEAYGGGGGTFAHEAVLIEEQIRAGDPSMGFAVHCTIVAHYLLAYASEAQKQKWLPKLASGEWVGAIAMTEPGTGSDLQAISTRAVREGDFYRVSGAKTFISNGHVCDFLIIVARTGDAKGHAGISLLCARGLRHDARLPAGPHPRQARRQGPGHDRAASSMT